MTNRFARMEDALKDSISFNDWNEKFGLVTDATPAPRRSDVSHTDGLYIRDWRTKAGLSMPDTAEALGMSVQHYSRIEHGQVKVTLDVIVRIATLFGCRDMTELLEPPGSQQNG